jgi:hypothetical protein
VAFGSTEVGTASTSTRSDELRDVEGSPPEHPLWEWLGAKCPVEAIGWLVPIEYRPFESGQALADAAFGQMDEKRLAESLAALWSRVRILDSIP